MDNILAAQKTISGQENNSLFFLPKSLLIWEPTPYETKLIQKVHVNEMGLIFKIPSLQCTLAILVQKGWLNLLKQTQNYTLVPGCRQEFQGQGFVLDLGPIALKPPRERLYIESFPGHHTRYFEPIEVEWSLGTGIILSFQMLVSIY